eukprot:TRINITY_DN1516_c0_g1_i1.p2 TRINITY_DN1516_c0_g1~~TRINITY_DN1516_c0_g1_i1.p2  ORF type:complete len:141 (-),score=12.17 TRINITY_DN1516_c0_g1_i1:966-1388(-)
MGTMLTSRAELDEEGLEESKALQLALTQVVTAAKAMQGSSQDMGIKVGQGNRRSSLLHAVLLIYLCYGARDRGLKSNRISITPHTLHAAVAGCVRWSSTAVSLLHTCVCARPQPRGPKFLPSSTDQPPFCMSTSDAMLGD